MIDIYIPEIRDYISYDVTNNIRPFYLNHDAFVSIETYNDAFNFTIPKGYHWDGCTIKTRFLQFVIGCSHTPEFVIASLLHDYILDNKELVGYDRELSSDIFETALINSGVGKIKAKVMRDVMNFYQKYWRGKEWEI